jgi:hypothetical protein
VKCIYILKIEFCLCPATRYSLPFTALDGQSYTLEGVKIILGANCLHVEAMMTTLYTKIVSQSSGTVLREGIVVIPPLGVLALAASVRAVGAGNDADKVAALATVFGYAEQTLQTLCFSDANYEFSFWYLWAAQEDGSAGFLIDLIKQPDQLELRLDTYAATAAPVVTRQFLPLSAFADRGNGTLVFGQQCVLMQARGSLACQVTSGATNLTVTASFALTSRSNAFVPATIEDAVRGLLPDVVSTYGTLGSGTRAAGVAYAAGLPMVFTTYPIRAGIDYWQWAMISAQRFPGTDLAAEVMAIELGKVWLATGYVLFKGKEYHVDDPFVLAASIETRGEISGGNRIFTSTIRLGVDDVLDLHCSAPVGQFAVLDREGKTTIHTTVLGSCVAQIKGATFHSGNNVLLELKSISN